MTSEEQITNDQELPAISQYYAARLLLCPAVHPSLLSKRQRPEDAIAEVLGWEAPQVEEADVEGLRMSLRVIDKILKSDVRNDERQRKATLILRTELGLSELDVAILIFACLLQYDTIVSAIASCVVVRSKRQLIRIIAATIGHSVSEVRDALSHESKLIQGGLITTNNTTYVHSDLGDCLSINEVLGDALLDRDLSREKLFKQVSRSAPTPLLSVEDYPQIAAEVAFLVDLIQGASSTRAKGVNILLYGPPGTGKTQLARTLVKAASLYAMEATDQDSEQNALTSDQRLSSYAIGQRLLSGTNNTVIIFDEVEEILDSNDSLQINFMMEQSKRPSSMKSWKNRLLEDNPIPTIWIANKVHRVDDALLRRFTYSLKINIPPRSGRAKMIANAFKPFQISQTTLDKMADCPNLTPADIERTLKAVDLAGAPPGTEEDRIAIALSGRYDGVALGRNKSAGRFLTMPYNPSWINTKPGLSKVADMLSMRKEGRLLFSGPPGTGKTAFAKHLAKELDAPLLLKRASDLLSPYVGETEMKIMRAFKEAQSDSALLFIDEADSFLQDRRSAVRSWEFSQVNELLTQIDSHEGYLILATNFPGHLDTALSRRIDLKVEFHCLAEVSGIEAICGVANALGIGDEEIKKALAIKKLQINALTLGDIAAALRQTQLRTIQPEATILADALQQELEIRRSQYSKPIGFV